MGLTKRGAVEDLIEKAGGCAVIDGGLATQLEALGANFDDPLWSALCLIANPDLIEQVQKNLLLFTVLILYLFIFCGRFSIVISTLSVSIIHQEFKSII